MKGISSIIVIILVLFISVVITAFAFTFFIKVQENVFIETEETIESQIQIIGTFLSIDSAYGNIIYIRNNGGTSVSNLVFYAGGNQIDYTGPGSLDPGKTEAYVLNESQLSSLTYPATLVVSSAGSTIKYSLNEPSVHVNEPIVAALEEGEIVLTGSYLGNQTTGFIRFDYNGGSDFLFGVSPLVNEWKFNMINFSLPSGNKSGTLTVIANGRESAPIDFFVYNYSSVNIPISLGTNALPLAITVTDDGWIWLNQEFHLELHNISPGGIVYNFSIPRHPSGIFATTIFGDRKTNTSVLGEDIEIAPDGGIWFTEGGGYLYNDSPSVIGGLHLNTARIVRYDPGTRTFECYNSPIDDSEVMGLLIDDVNDLIWYAEGDLTNGNAITAFRPSSIVSNCFFDPRNDPRDPICLSNSFDPTEWNGCHRRFSLPNKTQDVIIERGLNTLLYNPNMSEQPAHLSMDSAGNIWYTKFWGDKIGRLTPQTGEIVELLLPTPQVTTGPVEIAGIGPWSIEFDSGGNLWATEYFDITLIKINPSLMSTSDCTVLDAQGKNPCVEDIFSSPPDPSVNATMHSLKIAEDGKVWFSLKSNTTKIGFFSPTHDYTVFLAQVPDEVAEIAEDPVTGDIVFAEFFGKKIGRLHKIE